MKLPTDLKKFFITSGIILSTLTAVIGGINEFYEFSSDWINSSNKDKNHIQAQIDTLNKEVSTLNSEIFTLEMNMNRLAIVPQSMPMTAPIIAPSIPQVASTIISTPTKKVHFGLIFAIIGLGGLAISIIINLRRNKLINLSKKA